MNAADIRAVFSMKPTEAVTYLQQKGYDLTWDWQDLLDDAHATAFTVAKVAKLDILQDLKTSLEKALEHGQTFEQWSKEIMPVLQSKGWWGKTTVTNPYGAEQSTQLGSPRRLETIYLTNMQSAYMAGRYARMRDSRDTHPYWEYIAIRDNRTRPSHAVLHGTLMSADDPAWNTMYPPLDYRCRCRVVARSRAHVEGRTITSPELDTQTITLAPNEHTGEARATQITGVRVNGKAVYPSPGFNANQGQSMLSRIATVAVDKAQSTHPDIARVALKEMMANERFKKSLTAAQLAWVLQLLGAGS